MLLILQSGLIKKTTQGGTMNFYSQHTELSIRISLNPSELLGRLESEEPVVIPHLDGYIILKILKITHTKKNLEIVAQVLPKLETLTSIINDEYLILTSVK